MKKTLAETIRMRKKAETIERREWLEWVCNHTDILESRVTRKLSVYTVLQKS